MKSEKLFIEWMAASLGFTLVGCLSISVAEEGILSLHPQDCSFEAFCTESALEVLHCIVCPEAVAVQGY